MEEQQKDEAKVGEHWFCERGRQCKDEAEEVEDVEQLPPELQDDKDDEDDKGDEEAVGPKSKQQKLWHLFQISANSVAQLYKGSDCPQSELSMWDSFQSASMALTSLYEESRDAQQRSFNLGVQVGNQRRIKDVLDWAKKGQSTILREDLISFLCGKVPPDPPPVPPHLPPPYSPKMATESSSSLDFNLQPFQEAINLHELSGAMASISLQPGPPSSPSQAGAFSSNVASGDLQNSSTLKEDLSSGNSEDLALHLASGEIGKRTLGECDDVITNFPTRKRNRMV
ncbi:HUWE1-associated protein modifying stress responses 2 [Myotis daubentonii]|uniref:HUWE1-associated protein modifying stress responses 2 n=1 Tax=Myotis daubentonii TaxID=98922 RepID=UPI002872C698|nr:HUWE1-associated protein modifying stress responses 2 [Myotis daubentonii]